MNNKIAIIGSGALATALAKILHDGGQTNLVVFGIDPVELKDLSEGKNTKYFPITTKIPHLQTTSDLTAAVQDAQYVIFAVPSKTMDKVAPLVINALNVPVILINGSKGFYPGNGLSLHEGIASCAKGNQFVRAIVSLVGPSHAEEMVEEIPTVVTAVNENVKNCLEIQKLFTNDYFRVYAQTDVKGAMACSAFKNVLAIASGIASGLGGGINTTAALLTRGLVEMKKFVEIEGGDVETANGLTGIGDLIVTATSDLSRNYSTGKLIATKGVDAIPADTTVEGLEALKFVYAKAKAKHIDLPLTNFLFEVIIEKTKKPNEFKNDLWDRKLKEE